MTNHNSILLVADIGNTNSKVAVFREGRMSQLLERTDPESEAFQQMLLMYPPGAWLISSVSAQTEAFRAKLSAHAPGFVLDHQTHLPIQITYTTPETLGHDRIANMVAAQAAYPSQPVLVIDAGTCIKYDIMHPDAIYPGGTIAPGLQMRFRAMHTFTDRLPLLELSEIDPKAMIPVTGHSTSTSMISGALASALFEARGMISHYQDQFGNLKVMLTGGDAPFFASRLKNQIFAVPNLTLEGLRIILEFNLKHL